MKNFLYICLLAIGISICACDDALEKYPLDKPSSSSYPSNETELEMALWGCYGSLWLGTNYGMVMPALLDITTDIAWERAEVSMQSIGNGSHDANNSWVELLWKNYYISIARCNYLLDNMERAKAETTPVVYDRIKGETRFLRAYFYLMLTETWGDVPLVTKTLTLEEAQLPKTSKKEIVNFILKELDESIPFLPVHIGSSEKGRISQGTAQAIKARTALYNKMYEVVASETKKVIDSGEYQIDDNFKDLFKSGTQPNSKEMMFYINYKEGYRTPGIINGCTSRMGGGYSSKIPVQSLVDSYACIDGLPIDESPLYDPAHPFEQRDPRLGYTIVLPGTEYMGFQFETHKDSVECWNYKTVPATRVANQDALNPYATFSGYVWRKYDEISNPNELYNSETAFIIMRYADVLLMYAEAKIELGEIDASVYDAINQVRQRKSVGMPSISNKTQAELRSIVRRERKCEFAWEGLRWSDIRRWGIVEKAMTGALYGRPPRDYTHSAPEIDENSIPDYSAVSNKDDMRVIELRTFNSERDYVMPIPRIEIETNPALTQNPNY
ncbi:RagB/SusD family nutrient uptake outer membrane protein [Parabacteroides pacaensis]|uniref:RagB/SusD family nutrient uptake outer membrane protein n=1 Tax=Parabacteroides pacaensis TaxID=2086575 RepID=UPI00131AD818|nr:RagB/SusD family nutrient uptake outer membrane protein [Parabacteroides pacaensis]